MIFAHVGGGRTSSRQAHRLSRPAMTHGKILIVDDEAAARTSLTDLLRSEGYATEAAPDGFKALVRTQEFEPDLVLTDLNMPGIDGVELLRKLKETNPDLPVVLMTA